MEGTCIIVDAFQHVIYLLVYCSYSVHLFFCSGRGEFVVVIKVCDLWIEAIDISASGIFVGSSGCALVRKILQPVTILASDLPIMAVDAEILLECPDCSFGKFSCLWIVRNGEAEVDIELLIKVFKVLCGK